MGPDGNIWYTEPYTSDILGRLTPTGQITGFHTGFDAYGVAEIVSGPDGKLWFARTDANAIGRIDPTAADPGSTIQIYDLPVSNPGIGAGGNTVRGLTFDSQGRLWMAEQNTSQPRFFESGANRPEDAIYGFALRSTNGQPLNGAGRYVLHFPKGQTPPVDAFWSFTIYDEKGFPVENAIHRHALRDRDKLEFNADGSLTLYVQHQPPGTNKESNWLPAPGGEFRLVLRCYSPRPAITSGEWVPPPVSMQPAE
jgi:hypothetical protein